MAEVHLLENRLKETLFKKNLSGRNLTDTVISSIIPTPL